MRPFSTPEKTYSSSVAIDASTVDGVTVAVACRAKRREEIDVLESLCGDSDPQRFVPFATKSRSLDRRADSRFFEATIEANRTRLRGSHHSHRWDANTHRIEAVLSAILVDDILDDVIATPLVLVDGDSETVRSLARALIALRPEIPPVTNCFRAETYYPHSLLSDLAAHFLAGRLADGRHGDAESHLDVPAASQLQGGEWGRAYSSVATSNSEMDPVDLPSCFGAEHRERVCCWFGGAMARDTDPAHRPNPSIQPALRFLEARDYGSLSERLAAL